MDFNYPAADIKRGSTVNPADLHDFFTAPSAFDGFSPVATAALADLSSVDSAVDLNSFHKQWSPAVKLEPLEQPFDTFFDLSENSASAVSASSSPSQDMIFSNANSPGDLFRDQSNTSSPEATTGLPEQDFKPQLQPDEWKMFPSPEAIHIPQAPEKATVQLFPDKTKTRAETQIKVQLILDPVDDRFEYIRFPRKTLAKPKLLATADEKEEMETKGEAVHMDLYLVCATAIEKQDKLQQALRRARGDEPIPRRPAKVAITDLDKEDPAHPQNGGEVLICDGCKERERKRYDRKKKRAEDEKQWWQYEDDRIIMINEKEYKKWKDAESGDTSLSPRAKQVEFAMRIACYCRHQEEKSPVGYRVIFTFKDAAGNLIAQHTSEIFQITDDHKNKEVAPEAQPRPLSIPQYVPTQYAAHPNVVPIYSGYSMDGQYSQPNSLPAYSQPQTPIMGSFQSPMSPIEGQYPQPTTPTAVPARHPPAFNSAAQGMPSTFARTNTQPQYEAPMLSPTCPVPSDNPYLPRPNSMDNFNFYSMQYPAHPGFASAPPSAVSTPINLSRPASPSWDQGPSQKKKMMCFYVYVDDE